VPPRGSSRRLRIRWLLFGLAAGLLFSLLHPSTAWQDTPPGFSPLFADALWYVQYFLVFGALAWGIEHLRRRLPLVEGPRRNLYLHAASSVVFTMVHPGITVLLFVLENPHLPWGIRYRTDFGAGYPRFFHHELIFYWFILAIGEAVAYDRRVRGQRIAHHNLERQLARARLSALEMQLHPHFLYNTLNSIAELIYQSPVSADRALARLSTLIERVHYPFDQQLVTLRSEVEFLEQYLALEQLRFEDRLDLRIDFPAPLLGLRVPALILQPLVENAVRHGAVRMDRRSVLSVVAHRDTDLLVIEIENEIPGHPAASERGRRVGGLGLVNTSARLRQVYGDRARLRVEDAPERGRFSVRLELPLSFFSDLESSAAASSASRPAGWTVERAAG
jgi:hypothetical protein